MRTLVNVKSSEDFESKNRFGVMDARPHFFHNLPLTHRLLHHYKTPKLPPVERFNGTTFGKFLPPEAIF